MAPVFRSGIVRSDVRDGLINSSKLLDGTIKGEDQSKADFIQTGLNSVDTVSTWIAFGTAFADTAGLQVTASPVDVATDVRVASITAGSFEAIAAAAVSARWTAIRTG